MRRKAILGLGAASARAGLLAFVALILCACASGGPRPGLAGDGSAPIAKPGSRYAGYRVGSPYQVNGVWYTPREQPGYDEVGFASWYGERFHNHYTADGEVFDMRLASAAHKTLPLPCLVEVTNLANGRTLMVRVNDRGPFIDGRIIDLSREAAAELGFVTAGVTQVRVRYVGPAPDPGPARVYQASNQPRPATHIAAPAGPTRPAPVADIDALLANLADAPQEPPPRRATGRRRDLPAPAS